MNIRTLTLFLSTSIMTLLPGCVTERSDQSPGTWDHMTGYHGYGGSFMWLIWIVIAAVIIYAILNAGKLSGNSGSSDKESPLEILKRRYAEGEISKDEFEKMKNEIRE